MMGIVESVAALHAKAPVVRRPVAAGDELDDVGALMHVVGELATDAAEGADRVHLLVDYLQPGVAGRHQRAGGAGLHALAAGYAGRLAHRVVEIEHDLRFLSPPGVPDHIINLLRAACAPHAPAPDPGVEHHPDAPTTR